MTASEPADNGVTPDVSQRKKAMPDAGVGSVRTPGPPHAAEGQVSDGAPPVKRLRLSRATQVVIVGAVASATASALITPALFGGLWDAIAGTSSPSTSMAPSPTPAELSRKSNRSGSISLEMPKGWAIGNTRHNPFKDFSPGDAFAAGTNPSLPVSSIVSRIWVAASRDSAKRLREIDPDPDVAARVELEKYDWRLDGCQLASDSSFPGEALRGPMRKWVGCNGLDDQSKWEAWTFTPDGRAAVFVQFDLRADDMDENTASKILESIAVDPSRLSG